MPNKITFPGVYVEETPATVRTITGVATTITAFIGPTRRGPVNKPARILSLAEYEQRFGALASNLETGYAVRQFFQNGGTEAWVVRISLRATKLQISKGLQALNAVDLFNLLVLPGVTASASVALAAGYCEKRRAFLIVDAPTRAKTPDRMQQVTGDLAFESKSYAAIYYPWVMIADPLNNDRPRLSPPSGTIAGMIARMDASRGVWKAPGGTEASLKGVVGLEHSLTEAENGLLNPRGINCLRSFPSHGFVAWGARTLAGEDQSAAEFKYIPVRRMALFIEESLDRGTKWAVFEPNDEFLWSKLRLNIGAFLQNLFRQGAFQGRTPREACFVKCDLETTTQGDINAGVVNVLVGFAPLKPAEFVMLKLTQHAGQAAP